MFFDVFLHRLSYYFFLCCVRFVFHSYWLWATIAILLLPRLFRAKIAHVLDWMACIHKIYWNEHEKQSPACVMVIKSNGLRVFSCSFVEVVVVVVFSCLLLLFYIYTTIVCVVLCIWYVRLEPMCNVWPYAYMSHMPNARNAFKTVWMWSNSSLLVLLLLFFLDFPFW